MIETTHLRLEQAAEILKSDLDTLLIAAVEGRIRLFGFLNASRVAELGRPEPIDDGPEPRIDWIVYDTATRFFTFVPIYPMDAASLLQSGVCGLSGSRLSDTDEAGMCWTDAEAEHGIMPSAKIQFTRDCLFVKRKQVEWIRDQGELPEPNTAPEPALPTTHHQRHQSDHLVALNHAAARFWANADPDAPDTHPDNIEVAQWLEKRGLSATLASKAASILRPKWAHVGRKPEK